MIEKRLGVVIPIANMGMYETLSENIRSNKILPDICVLINNSNEPIFSPPIDNTIVVEIKPRIGVNESWEIGARLCGDVDYVSILNDDIKIGEDFFDRILKAFEAIPLAGAICPWTYTLRHPEDPPKKLTIIKMNGVEGWAFTIKKEILNGSFPMPEGMRTFAGDNWLWWYSYRKFNMFWYKDMENRIFHHVGSSMTKRIKNDLKKEKKICSKGLEERLGEKYGKLQEVPVEIFEKFVKEEDD